jgi:hypothetical protein
MDYAIGIHVEEMSDDLIVVGASAWYANASSKRVNLADLPFALVRNKRVDRGIMAAVNRAMEKMYLKGLLSLDDNNRVRLITAKKHHLGRYENAHKLEISRRHWLIENSKRVVKDRIDNGMFT